MLRFAYFYRRKKLKSYAKMKKIIITTIVVSLLFVGCNSSTERSGSGSPKREAANISHVKHPDWSVAANIYEVNLRQFTKEGTLKAFIRHMPRLRNMGVDILWFMPIQPIGKKNRKGTMGSYYSVRDYEEVDHDYGYIDEFQKVVELAHQLGMYVILDWVADHTAWDHPWVTSHPEWYAKDENGNMIAPHGWSDVVQLDYDNQDMRRAMMEAMKYWIVEADIDGFRCDVADMVPLDFWENTRKYLEKTKPLFMLAEAEDNALLINAFDMDFGWTLHHITNAVAKGDSSVNALEDYFNRYNAHFPEGAYIMNFTSNHDENSWNGTVRERYGEGYKTFAVLMATVPGMPLIYGGQEAGLNKRLEFFEKDVIDWKNYPLQDFYRTLLNTKKRNQALWNGNLGGELVRVKTDHDDAVFAFTRKKYESAVFVILNLTGETQNITLKGKDYTGKYTNIFNNEKVTFIEDHQLQLKPWDYRVYEK